MLPTTDAYKKAIKAQNKQHISGTIELKNGVVLPLVNYIVSDPIINRQCTADANVFNIGQIYTGTVNATIRSEKNQYFRQSLIGGKIIMKFSIDGASDEILLGTWEISEANRDSGGNIAITGVDCTAKLNVEIPNGAPAFYHISNHLKAVEDCSGVKFAQTEEEIRELMGLNVDVPTTSFFKTCRETVSALAALMGCFACDDRQGRIIFKKFSDTVEKYIENGTEKEYKIAANERHKAVLEECDYSIWRLLFSTELGKVYLPVNQKESGAKGTLEIPESEYFPAAYKSKGEDYINTAMLIKERANYSCTKNIPKNNWTPGQIEYYGDPSLELGDRIIIEGGINSEHSEFFTDFLITAETWQFRGPHTLISAGASMNGISPSAGSSGSNQQQQILMTIDNSKTIEAVNFDSFEGICTGNFYRTVASKKIYLKEGGNVFFSVTACFTAESNCDVKLNLLVNGIKQKTHAKSTVRSGDKVTISFDACGNLPYKSDGCNITVEAIGEANLDRITAYAWGQTIFKYLGASTDSEDYEYLIDEDKVEIRKYIGTKKEPMIPKYIEGKEVKYIGKKAFINDKNIEYVYIPEGVEEIK